MSDVREILPTIRDQGQRNTCLSLALSDGHTVARKGPPMLAADYLHFNASRIAKVGINDAVSAFAAMTALERAGQPAENECPYSRSARSPQWAPTGLTGATFKRKSRLEMQGVWPTIERDVSSGSALVLIVSIDDAFWEPTHGVIERPNGTVRGSHALLAVAVAAAAPRVLVRNSWGPEWGEEGYAWISREYLDARCDGVISMGEPA